MSETNSEVGNKDFKQIPQRPAVNPGQIFSPDPSDKAAGAMNSNWNPTPISMNESQGRTQALPWLPWWAKVNEFFIFTLPDMVVTELGVLRSVEQHRPRRGIYGIRLGSGAGHLIICLAVTGGRASGSCTVGLMGERRGWVSEWVNGWETDRETGRGREWQRDIDRVYSSKGDRRVPKICSRCECSGRWGWLSDVSRYKHPLLPVPSPPFCLSLLLCRYR